MGTLVCARGMAVSLLMSVLTIGTATAGDVGTGTDAGTHLGDGVDGELFPCPKDTIVLMPYVPVIPLQYRVFVETSSHLHIDYNIYWDYDKHGGEQPMCQPTTPELLDKHARQVAMFGQADQKTLKDVCSHVLQEVFIFAIAAFLYKKFVTDIRSPLPENIQRQWTGFHYGLCEFFKTPSLCCLVCCCLPVRLADTVQAAGILDFWQAFGVYVGTTTAITFLSFFTGGKAGILWPVACFLLFAKWRRDLREKLGASPVAGMVSQDRLVDTLKWCCFPTCAVIQEAREIDRETGVAYECPCNLRKIEQALLVGQPVTAYE